MSRWFPLVPFSFGTQSIKSADEVFEFSCKNTSWHAYQEDINERYRYSPYNFLQSMIIVSSTVTSII